ncbi:MAG: UDP-N-acetylmuramate--L-alanine ligase [Clostridia bacterium]|nr:UDP-N-acetylmuramate--L-alanine ligase [Clostridia bacterium]
MHVHFIGVGGIGNSSLAKYLISKGFCVSGSDSTYSLLVKELERLGVKIAKDDEDKLVENCDVVVISSAIKEENKSLILAKKLKKPIYKRSQLLKIITACFDLSIGIAGSHGKTTTTAMLANVLHCGGLDFTAFIGGMDSAFGNFYYKPNSKIVLSEVCEYDKNIYDFNASIAVVLNVDNDHLDTYKNIENLCTAFYDYLDRASVKIVCADDKILDNYNGKKITYGIENDADFKAVNLHEKSGRYSFDLMLKGKKLFKVNLSVFGKHNVLNALSAIVVAKQLNVQNKHILEGLKSFKGVGRRFETLGKIGETKFIADYSHHPTEIKCTIETLKQLYKGDYLLIFEPHTYSRTKLLFKDFINVFNNENVIIYKTFSAREKYDYYGSACYLAKNIKGATYVKNFKNLLEITKKTNASNVVILGAGNLYWKIKNAIKMK